MSTTQLSLERCKQSIILLSLDLTIPAYEHMGLLFPEGHKADFAEELRGVIRILGGASVTIPIPPNLVDNVLQRIARRLGNPARDQYLDWVTHLYEESPSDHPHTLAWSTILTWSAAIPLRWRALDLPKDIASTLREDMRMSTVWPEFETLYDRATERPLSEWDAQILEVRRFDDGPWNPGLAIECNVYRYRFRCALKRLVDRLSEENVLSFWQKVQSLGLANELTEIDDLRGPKDLREPQW